MAHARSPPEAPGARLRTRRRFAVRVVLALIIRARVVDPREAARPAQTYQRTSIRAARERGDLAVTRARAAGRALRLSLDHERARGRDHQGPDEAAEVDEVVVRQDRQAAADVLQAPQPVERRDEVRLVYRGRKRVVLRGAGPGISFFLSAANAELRARNLARRILVLARSNTSGFALSRPRRAVLTSLNCVCEAQGVNARVSRRRALTRGRAGYL